MSSKIDWSELVPKDTSLGADLVLQKKGEALAKVVVFWSLENSKVIYERKLILKDLEITDNKENFRKLFIKFVILYLWWFQYNLSKISQLNPREQGIIAQKFTQTLNSKIAILFELGPEWLKEFKNQCDDEFSNYDGKVFLDPANLPNSVVWQFSKDTLDIFGVHEDLPKTMEVVALTSTSAEFLNLPELLKP